MKEGESGSIADVSGQYPEDEFDSIPEGGPVGIHRKPRSPWRAVLPFFIVLLLVPLLAWGITALVRNRASDEGFVFVEEEQSTEQVQSEPEELVVEEDGNEEVIIEDDPEAGPTAAPDDPLSTEGTVSEQPAEITGEVFYDTSIAVLNASGIAGLAGQNTQQLLDAGFVNAWSGNSADTGTPENTVYYTNSDLAATAQQVAQVLGISAIVEDSAVTGGTGIVVLLRG